MPELEPSWNEDELVSSPGSSAVAFAAFYRRYERLVLRFFLGATGQPELAADLTAESFARALESVADFDPARGRADQWLFGIARNTLADSHRRGRVDAASRTRLGLPRLILDDHAAETIARLGSAQSEATLALARLPRDQRDAVEAHVVHERDYADIAGEFDCSEAVVRQRVSRGLRNLRTRLAGGR